MKIEGVSYHYVPGFTLDGALESQARKPLGFSQYSGTVCQQSGTWLSRQAAQQVVVSIEKGTVMPHHAGRVVQWVLDSYLPWDGVNHTPSRPHSG